MKKFFKTKYRAVMAVVLSLLVFSAYGNIVQLQKAGNQQQQVKELKADLKSKEEEYDSLREEYSSTLSQKADYESDYYDLSEEYDELEEKYNELNEKQNQKEEKKSAASYDTASSEAPSAAVSSYSSNHSDDSDVTDSSDSYSVHITKTGDKYHSAGCQYLRQSDIVITKSEAVQRGLDPCSKCNL